MDSRMAGLILIFLLPLNVDFCVGDQMILLQAMWRHGGRNPILTFPTDTNNTSPTWPRGFGELTVEGMYMQFQLGQRIFQKYANTTPQFLSQGYVQGDVYVESSNVDRTYMSAYSNQLGHYRWVTHAGTDYPLYGYWPTGYMPVVDHLSSTSVGTDSFANPDAPCARQTALQALWPQTPEYQAMWAANGAFLQNLSTWTGQNVTMTDSTQNVFYVWDTLMIEKAAGRATPSWFTTAVLNQMVQLKDTVLSYILGLGFAPLNGVSFKLEAARIRAGTILPTLANNMQGRVNCLQTGANCPNVVNCTTSACTSQLAQKYYAYSMHDVTVSALLIGLGLNQTNFYSASGQGPYYPAYADAVILETWATNSLGANPYYRVYYWPYLANGSSIELTAQIPGCTQSGGCPLSTLTASNNLPPGGLTTYCANTTL